MRKLRLGMGNSLKNEDADLPELQPPREEAGECQIRRSHASITTAARCAVGAATAGNGAGISMEDATRKRFFSSEEQTWATPPALFAKFNEVFSFSLDPCASEKTAKCAAFYTIKEDGLKQPWSCIGNSFVNPPFGRQIQKWIKKSYEEAREGGRIVAMLIPARPDTEAWHTYILPHAKILFIRGRITFLDQREGQPQRNSAAFFPSALVVFGKTEGYKLEKLNDLGIWLEARKE